MVATRRAHSFSRLAAVLLVFLSAGCGGGPRRPVDGVEIDDASRLNALVVAEIWDIPAEAGEAERRLAALLRRAARDRVKVSIAGARHSMGGHTIHPGGVVVNMLPYNRVELDEARGLLRVGAGARWSRVVPYLDARGLSVAVMQSNNDFTAGGSVSVNVHGWQHGQPPIASTVESLRLMTAAGSVVRCSRTENAELFSLALGGYGLFGVILDVELRVVPNERYRLRRWVVPAAQYARAYSTNVGERAEVGMAYGRLCVVPGEMFLREAILNVYERDPAADGSIPRLESPAGLARLERAIFRGSVASDMGKRLRWEAEKSLQHRVAPEHCSRNRLIHESAEVFANHTAGTTDLLHEYFVPRDAMAAFLEMARDIVPRHRGNLLNVTVRDVREDRDSFLRYADADLFALVMLFNQPRTAEGETAMVAMTRELIDAALSLGGRYYLPYRLHATREQFRRAYPMAPGFFDLKRKYDPEGLFRNRFYETYGE